MPRLDLQQSQGVAEVFALRRACRTGARADILPGVPLGIRRTKF
jgi:hypothetical protein